MTTFVLVQEGPGAGPSYPLDPRQQPEFSVGRSSGCDIGLADQRASRHHCDLRWNGRNWQVIDRGSTNGTFVNGVQIHGVHELRPGDRITAGETTLVLQELPGAAAPTSSAPVHKQAALVVSREDPSRRQSAPTPQSPSGAQDRARPGRGLTAVYWLVHGLVAAGIVCLGAGAFLPWLQVTGSLTKDLQPLLQGLADIVAVLSGQDSIFNVSQQISGLEGYGKLTLLVALLSSIALIVDILLRRRTAIPGVVYLLSSLMAGGAIAFDLINYYRFYSQMQDLSLLFGIRLEQVVEVFDQFLDVAVTPMVGLVLTGLGLVLLFVGAIGRLILAVLDRSGSHI